MNNSNQPENIIVSNERSLKKLVRSITNSQGYFTLILACCNYHSLREQIVQQLKAECQVEIRELHLSKSVKTLYTTIEADLGDQLPQALMIFGLELNEDIDQVLISTNQVREEFRKNFQFPIVIWVNDEIFQKLIRLIPDFKSWTGNSIKFKATTNELLENLRQSTSSVFAAILTAGGSKFLDNASLNIDFATLNLGEIESALRDLQISQQQLEPDLEASVQFLLGREADIRGHKSEARNYYEQSLVVWEQKVKDQTNISSEALKCYGCLLWHLGLWWQQCATLHIAEHHEAYLKAKDYFQKCVEVFQQHNCPDLAAKFINNWGEALTKLEAWNELENVASIAIKLHQTYPEPIRLAYSYGLIAEVALKKSQWVEAKEYAELALQTNDASSNITNTSLGQTINWEWEKKYYHNLYLLLVAEAQKNLNQVIEAIANLETARRESNPQYDPLLYIRILATLRSIYFEQGNYLEAFQVKLEQRSIEQQYGLRAFVGAGRLQSRLQVINPVLAETQQKAAVTQEIAASGRMQDVNRLIERIGRPDHKLTVIYGQSGVGKSSLVQAGLLPALKERAIDARDVVPVLLQVYTDWTKVIGTRLVESLEEVRGLSFPLFLDSMTSFIEELNKNIDKDLLTVLIFDQFEEFFFAYKDTTTRKPFFELISECLNVPYVKIILSLREDYLHYLLECNRLTPLDAIDRNILDKNNLYYLGNFSPQDARSVIQSLTQSSQLYLEPLLIDELVRDLAGTLNEVRPIELQVVGAQLQTDKITTLVQYQKHGPKEKLVGRFLEEVIKDCGQNNEQFAKLVLYLLTDENNTRPLKTRAELEADLALEPTRLDLILKILVKSGLVFQVPGFPADRYQLVHDYLVPFVREQQSARLIAELEKEKEQRKLTEAKLNQVLKEQLKTARRQMITLVGLVAAISGIAIAAIGTGINTYLTSLSSSSGDDSGLESLISAIKAGKELKKYSIGTIPEVRLRVISQLSQVIQNVKEINRIQGDEKNITALSFSNDSRMLVTASEDGTAKVWSVPDGNLITTLQGHTKGITSVSFRPDGRMLATASKDGTAIIWSIPDGKKIKILKGHTKGVTFVTFSPNAQLLATASEDKTVKIWNLKGYQIHNLNVKSDQGEIVSFSPDNKIVTTGGEYDTVQLWNLDVKNYKPRTIDDYGTSSMNFLNSGKTINILNKKGKLTLWSTRENEDIIKINEICNGFEGEILTISHDNKFLIVRDSNKKSVNKYRLVRNNYNNCYSSDNTTFEHNESITNAVFSYNDKLLATVSKDGVVKLWDIKYKVPTLTTKSGEEIKKIRFSFNGKIAALGSNNNMIEIKKRDGSFISTIPGDSSILSFSHDNQTLATGSPDDFLKLWKFDSKQEIPLKGSKNYITSINFSRDGEFIAATDASNLIRLWRSNGTLVKSLLSKTEKITNVIFSPNSHILASIGNNSVTLYKLDGTLISILAGHTEKITNVTFSSNSQMLATIGDDNLVKLYKNDGSLIKTLTGHSTQVSSVEFSQDNSKLISVSPASGEIKLWRSSDGKPLQSVDNYGTLSANFSNRGNFITSINQGNTVKLWSLNGELLTTLKGHSAGIRQVGFNLDETKIATSSDDSTVKLWDVKKLLAKNDNYVPTTLREHTQGVNDVSFSPDGKLIASASADGTVKLWRSSDGQFIRTMPKFSDDINDDVGIYQVNFSSDGKIISAIGNKYTGYYNPYYRCYYVVKLWSIEGKPLKSIIGHLRDDTSINSFPLFNPDTKAVAFVRKDDSLQLWDIKGKHLASLRGHTDWVNSVTFSSDGETIASASDDKTVRLWDINGKLLKKISAHSDKVNSVSFSDNGKIIASASDDKTVKLWNVNDGSPHKPINPFNTISDQVASVVFSPDKDMIASISGSTINLDYINGKPRETIKETSGNSSILSFGDNGKKLAFGDYQDNIINLHFLDGIWQKEFSLYPISAFSGIPFSPDVQMIRVSNNEGTLLLNTDLDDLLKRACGLASGYLKNNPNVSVGEQKLCDDINYSEVVSK
jgi:WD40 repeat protein/tetratricopeptide (TPR) repeat protein